jgi:pimeloyl-ACP methyl ester carboxylesterase
MLIPEASRAWLKTAWDMRPVVGETVVRNAAIRYRGWSLDRADLPALVLIHGFRAHARWWDHIAPALADRFRLVAFDLAVARATGFDRATLVGHSYGGIISLLACKLYPEIFEGAVLIDTFMFPDGDETKTWATLPKRRYPTCEDGLKRYRLRPPGGWPDPEILDYLGRHSLTETADGWTWKYDPLLIQSLNQESFVPLLRRVEQPVRYVYGMLSEIVHPNMLPLAGKLLSVKGPPVPIPASHHHVPVEQPLALIAALNALLPLAA